MYEMPVTDARVSGRSFYSWELMLSASDKNCGSVLSALKQFTYSLQWVKNLTKV